MRKKKFTGERRDGDFKSSKGQFFLAVAHQRPIRVLYLTLLLSFPNDKVETSVPGKEEKGEEEKKRRMVSFSNDFLRHKVNVVGKWKIL